MKGTIKTLLALSLMSLFALPACLSDGDETVIMEDKKKSNDINGGDYFGIENASYHSGSMPSSTGGELCGVTMNSSALSGGMNFITVRSTQQYDKFYIGAEGVNGYYEYEPDDESYSNGAYTYIIPLEYAMDYSDDVTLKISGDNSSGVTSAYTQNVKYVESQYGALNINLTFENAKDLDLHVVTPSGMHLYYGSDNGFYETDKGRVVFFGLDHDSNAGCSIDNLNNENVLIPNDLVEAGEYKVYVNMYENCNTKISTSWIVAARYKNGLVSNTLGENPVKGVYPIGAKGSESSQLSNLVMKFRVSKSKSLSDGDDNIIPQSFIPKKKSDATKEKMLRN